MANSTERKGTWGVRLYQQPSQSSKEYIKDWYNEIFCKIRNIILLTIGLYDEWIQPGPNDSRWHVNESAVSNEPVRPVFRSITAGLFAGEAPASQLLHVLSLLQVILYFIDVSFLRIILIIWITCEARWIQ